MKMSTGEIVHRGLRYELMPVSMLISAAVSFCLLLKGVELLVLRPTRHTGALLFHRVVSVSDGKARSRAILVFFGLDPAPPRFRHARPHVRRPWHLDSLVLGMVSKSIVPDLFRKSARQEKGGTSPLAVCENKRAEIDGILVGKGIYFWAVLLQLQLGKCDATLFRVKSHYRRGDTHTYNMIKDEQLPKKCHEEQYRCSSLLIPHRPTLKIREETYVKE